MLRVGMTRSSMLLEWVLNARTKNGLMNMLTRTG